MSRATALTLFVASWLVPSSIQAVLSIKFADVGITVEPVALFVIVLIAASLCAMLAAVTLRQAFATDTAELALLSLFFMSASVLPLVHGITTPDVLYETNTATMSSAFWAVPLGVLLASPLLFARRRPVMRRWREWSIASLILLAALGALMLIKPDLIGFPEPRGFASLAMIALCMLGVITLTYRHYQLALIADRPAPLAVAAGIGLVAASSMIWLGAEPYSVGFWSAHALDIAGVFFGLGAIILVHRHSESARKALAPVLAVEPIAALEVGLEPIVREFVADLDAKDQITRDHVVRTSQLCIAVAAELGLSASRQRRVGLAGLLHDVGKLKIPDQILTKAGSLTDAEYAEMQDHVLHGETMILTTSTLSDLAPGIRSHHERVDGAGYPDGLAGDQIDLDARIVAACDAFDAMSQSRHYRKGMDLDVVIGVMQEHAGSQWDTEVVDALLRVVGRSTPASQPTLLASERTVGCDCLPVPDDQTLAGDKKYASR